MNGIIKGMVKESLENNIKNGEFMLNIVKVADGAAGIITVGSLVVIGGSKLMLKAIK